MVGSPSLRPDDGQVVKTLTELDFVRTRFERESDPTPEEIQALTREAKTKAEEQKLVNASKKTEKEGPLEAEASGKDDPLTSYRDKEPMSPAKIKEHEPTAVKREMTEKIVEKGQTGTNPEKRLK